MADLNPLLPSRVEKALFLFFPLLWIDKGVKDLASENQFVQTTPSCQCEAACSECTESCPAHLYPPRSTTVQPAVRWCHNKTGNVHHGQSKPRRAAGLDSEGRSIDLTPRDASQRDAGVLGGLSVSHPGVTFFLTVLWLWLQPYGPVWAHTFHFSHVLGSRRFWLQLTPWPVLFSLFLAWRGWRHFTGEFKTWDYRSLCLGRPSPRVPPFISSWLILRCAKLLFFFFWWIKDETGGTFIIIF